MKIIKYRKIFLGIAISFFVASIVLVCTYGLNPGMEFKGGTSWQIKISASQEEVKNFLATNVGLKNFSVFPEEETNSFIIRSDEISEVEHQNYATLLKDKFGSLEEIQFDSLGPAVGNELKQKALIAIICAIFGIALYIAFAFRKVSYPVRPWQYGAATIISLSHDVLVPTGIFAFLNFTRGTEMDINFLTALLVIMGFSVHDTVVVFDRIRENLLHSGNRSGIGKKELGEVIDSSVNQTLKRSIFTSCTVIIMLVSLFILGPASLKNFVLTLLIGISFGTYSSIFIASPLLYIFYKDKKVDKKR